MLNSVQILGLFGMYDYTIDLQQSSKKGLLFMTGPNGMGKSTILRLINALYNKDFATLCQIDYKEAVFVFETCKITLNRQQTVELIDDNSDVPSVKIEGLTYSYESISLDGKAPFTESCSWSYSEGQLSELPNPGASTNSLDLLMGSEKCLYIADNRLSQNNQDEVLYSSEHFRQFVEKLKVRLTDSMIPTGPIEANEFEGLDARVSEIEKQLKYLEDCGLDFPAQKEGLKSKLKEVVWHTCRCCEHAFKTCSEEIQKLSLFKEFLEDSHLVDKELEISLRRGYRLISKNLDRTILNYDMLSSGERHLIMQLMMLLISPQKISLVLIDEPEISFHLMWQMQYLKRISKIQDLRKCSILVATHSTQIFDSHFELTTDLWRQHKKDIEARKQKE